MRKLIVLLACALAFAGAAACGRDKTPDGTADAASRTTQDNPEDKLRAFAQCMRDHGVEMEDPEVVTDGNGGTRTKVKIGGPSGGPNGKGQAGPGDERFKQAEQECRHLMPKGGDLGKGPSPEEEEDMRDFAKCMRDNGVENFPDPQPGGGINISPENGVNPEDPAFQEAEKKCEELIPRRREKVTS